MKSQMHIYYTGSVQGVGFRFSVERTAASMGLSGWVKNLPDGRVEVMCEGDKSALKEFLTKIENIFTGYIKNTDVEYSEAAGGFSDFEVRF